VKALTIYKYLIECLDEQIVKTYSFERENFIVLRLHGGETYNLNGTNAADYWRQWEQETGHTSEDSTDICVIWREGFNVEKFFIAGKSANVQTVSPTTWTNDDIEKFFSFTERRLQSKLKLPLDSTILRVKTEGGQRFLIGTLDKPYPSIEKQKIPPINYNLNSKSPKPEKFAPSPARKKNSATSVDIAEAWRELSQKHDTN